MNIRLDDDQKRAVYAEPSAVVSAGAGSGKTTVLSQRFVWLVASGKARVDQILTLTFTRKAAAEMYERIYRSLRTAAPGAALAFDQAAISTLDSFCARIVRDRSDRFGITGDFVQDDLRAEELARSTALGIMLKKRRGSALDDYIDMYGFEGVLEDLFVALGTRYFTLADREGTGEALAVQRDRLLGEIGGLAGSAAELAEKILALDPAAHKQIADAQHHLAEAGLLEPPEDLEDPAEAERYSAALSAAGRAVQLPKGKGKHDDIALYQEYVKEWRQVTPDLVSALETLSAWPLFTELGEVIEEFRLAFEREKRAAGIVTFRDVPAMAVRLLEEEPEFRLTWKNAYRYIMIDEFQDNNDLQRKLLYLLAEKPERSGTGIPDAAELVPGKLFFVGDEKQSIYRFRGADVGVFKRLSREMEASGGTSVDLPRNYRSEPALIDFFNGFFPRIFASAEHDYEAEFRPLTGREPSPGIEPRIGFFYRGYDPDKGSEYLSDADSEAWYVARRIREMVEGGELAVPGGTAGYGDIALLMRSSGKQINFESAFRRLSIPYTVQSARALFLEAPVSDFYQLLQAALFPEDRLAYFSLLRSPFAGLSDEIIARLFLKERKEHLEPFALEPEDPVFGDESERYREVRETFLMVRDSCDRLPLSEIVRRLWHSRGYRYAVLRNPGYHVYLEYYDYLFELALRADRRGETLASFLDFIRENLGKYEKIEEIEPPREESVGVRIMSIHKSKGLQFPVVFIAGCGTIGTREGEGASPFYLHPDLGMTLAAPSKERKSGKANYFYRRGLEMDQEQEVAELKRLLYVAATRAEYHLFFSGYHGRNNRNFEKSGRFAFLNWIGAGFGAGTGEWENDPAFRGYLEIIPPVETAERDRASRRGGTVRSGPEAERFYASVPALRFEFPRESYSPSAFGAGQELSVFPGTSPEEESGVLPADRWLDGEEAVTAFGTLCHRAVEEGIRKGSVQAAELSLPAPLAALPAEARRSILDAAVGMATRFLESDFGKKARREAAAGRQASEVAFLYRTGKGRYIDGAIDLLLEGEEAEEALVVDFKSDRGGDPSRHLPQLAVYRQAAEELTGKKVRTFLWYLRRGEAVELDTAAPELKADALIDSLP